MRRPVLHVLPVLLALAALVAVRGALPVAAAAPSGGTSGADISWPQCGAPFPSGASFGVVGVNDGRAWSTNPCLASEYAWARGLSRTPDLYMNTANPAPQSSHYWPESGTRDPALCIDATSTTDPGCAYDYGWHTAADALARATAALGAAPAGRWWLDVETGNTWNGDASSNAADLQGSIDYLVAEGAPAVGVYSTEQQWAEITGGYASGTAAAYASAWAPEFASPSGIGAVPSWVAGAGPAGAPGLCADSFTGTTTAMVQYIAGGFDADAACAAVPALPPASLSPPPPAATAPGLPEHFCETC